MEYNLDAVEIANQLASQLSEANMEAVKFKVLCGQLEKALSEKDEKIAELEEKLAKKGKGGK